MVTKGVMLGNGNQKEPIYRARSKEQEAGRSDGLAGQPFDLDAYGQLTDRLGRAFQRLGLKPLDRRIGGRASEVGA
jgi:hypothetical protein